MLVPSPAAASPALDCVPVLVVDCQATGASPRYGHPIELAWAVHRASDGPPTVEHALLALPRGAALPRRVAQLTGLTDDDLATAPPAAAAWAGLAAAARALPPVADGVPVVAHFAHFERRFLEALGQAEGAAPAPALSWCCLHALAKRLLPALPRHSLRAIAGHLGHPIGLDKRAPDHVAATAAAWSGLVRLLADGPKVTTWPALLEWIATRRARRRAGRPTFPLAREARAALPDAPGVYRFLAGDGTVLYVGKAGSLRRRVMSHFHSRGAPSRGRDRHLELLAQVRDVAVTETCSALEAAVAEADAIKALAPAYNKALRRRVDATWFADAALDAVRAAPGDGFVRGPLPGPEAAAPLVALRVLIADPGRARDVALRGQAAGIGSGASVPADAFAAGLALFRDRHGLGAVPGAGRLLRLGASLWASERADGDDDDDDDSVGVEEAEAPRGWDADSIARALEHATLRAAHLLRRGAWLARLSQASIRFRPRGAAPEARRLLIVDGGQLVVARPTPEAGEIPVPPRPGRPLLARHQALDPDTYDRLRVLTTELRALLAADAPVEVRLGRGRPLGPRALRARLAWL